MPLSYKKVGVDIDEIRDSHAGIGRIISSTHGLREGVEVTTGFGHYAGVVEVPGAGLVATHTDGVGTKTMIASQMGKYDTVGIDCMAMNANDMACVGATPISFVDYIAANRNDTRILQEIAGGLAAGARKARVPIVGGETAIMPDMFAGDGFAFDLVGTIVGLASRGSLVLGDSIEEGDAIIGARSSGIHSNGYTLARKALLPKYSLNDTVGGVGNLGDALLEPTEIYSVPALEAVNSCTVHGLAHITGGAFTKLLRLKRTGYVIDSLPKMPPIMQLIQDQGVPEAEMYRTFNMGVGFCIMAPADQISPIGDIFKRRGIETFQIGRIVPGSGVTVNSMRIT